MQIKIIIIINMNMNLFANIRVVEECYCITLSGICTKNTYLVTFPLYIILSNRE